MAASGGGQYCSYIYAPTLQSLYLVYHCASYTKSNSTDKDPSKEITGKFIIQKTNFRLHNPILSNMDTHRR